jgi:hypothetical protein
MRCHCKFLLGEGYNPIQVKKPLFLTMAKSCRGLEPPMIAKLATEHPMAARKFLFETQGYIRGKRPANFGTSLSGTGA